MNVDFEIGCPAQLMSSEVTSSLGSGILKQPLKG